MMNDSAAALGGEAESGGEGCKIWEQRSRVSDCGVLSGVGGLLALEGALRAKA
jgi:hypothetical protein